MTEPPIDPTEHTIAELGPKIKDVDDLDDLRAILEAEESNDDRVGVKTLVESRIEKFEDDGKGDGEFDLAEMSTADVGNAIRDVDEVEELRDLLERERDGEDRDGVIGLIERRIDSVSEDDEDADAEPDVEPDLPPEEKHPGLDHPTADKRHVSTLDDGIYRDAWVYCETQAGELIDVSVEMLGKARELMDDYNETYDASERVVAVLIGDDVADHADDCIAYGADVVVYAEDDRLDRFQHKPYTELFCAMARSDADWKTGEVDRDESIDPEGDSVDPEGIERNGDGRGDADRGADDVVYDEPRYVLFPATNNGRDLSALVQAELDSGLASDCSGLYIDEVNISNPVKTGAPGTDKTFRRVLHMKRPDFSGFEYSTILCLDNPNRDFHPQGASVIPGSFERPAPDPDREGETVAFDGDVDDDWLRVDVTDHDRLDEGVDLTGHEVVVAVGRGIGDDPTRGLELAEELAGGFDDAAVGVSRGIVTGSYEVDGHVEKYTAEERQIGETGQVVEPDLYVAAGISGAIQHKVGCDEADTIVAINTDPEAGIRDWCDYFVEGDLFEVLPQLVDSLEADELKLPAEATADGGQTPDDEDAADTGGDN